MLKIILAAATIVVLSGCSAIGRFEKVASESLPKVVTIYVAGVAEVPVLVATKDGFDIETATRAVMVSGSGVFISPNNHILTCAHLFWLPKITGITVLREDGTMTAGELLSKDDALDLGLVQAFFDGVTPYARVAEPSSLRVGQEVVAIGSPLGQNFSVSHGIISALKRSDGETTMTQSDAFINPGNSGGPLFNLDGEVIGINSRLLPPVPAPIFTGLGFSVNPDDIVRFLDRIWQKYNFLRSGYTGIEPKGR